MCTVTFIPRSRGYVLGMNRDEQRSRIAGLPPRVWQSGKLPYLAPSEPSGGTWIAVNLHGTTFALLNWYSVPSLEQPRSPSRGTLIPKLASIRKASDALSHLRQLPLSRFQPFRLVGVFPEAQTIVEWRWNTRHLEENSSPWTTHLWVSSGFQETTAQQIRTATFTRAQHQKSSGTIAWLRRFHRSTSPEPGPFAVAMQRSDACTVSYTEIQVGPRSVRMRHAQPWPNDTFHTLHSPRTLHGTHRIHRHEPASHPR